MKDIKAANRWFRREAVKFEKERFRRNKEISNLYEHDLIECILHYDKLLDRIESDYEDYQHKIDFVRLPDLEGERIYDFCSSVIPLRIDILNYSPKLMRYVLYHREGKADMCPKPNPSFDFPYLKICGVRLPNDMPEVSRRDVSLYLIEGEHEEDYHIILNEEVIIDVETIKYKYLVKQVFISPALEEIYDPLPYVINGDIVDFDVDRLMASGFVENIKELGKYYLPFLN